MRIGCMKRTRPYHAFSAPYQLHIRTLSNRWAPPLNNCVQRAQIIATMATMACRGLRVCGVPPLSPNMSHATLYCALRLRKWQGLRGLQSRPNTLPCNTRWEKDKIKDGFLSFSLRTFFFLVCLPSAQVPAMSPNSLNLSSLWKITRASDSNQRHGQQPASALRQEASKTLKQSSGFTCSPPSQLKSRDRAVKAEHVGTPIVAVPL